MKTRCEWAGSDPLYIKYHDREWGVPVHRDRKLFEFLTLEGAQAGLSWITVLRKREHYRRCFDGFDYERIAEYGAVEVRRLLADPGIIRNEQKIRAAISNARAFLEVRREYGSFNRYIWDFVDGRPIQNRYQNMADLPASTVLSERISADLKRRGFRFVGPTIVYAHMQATGMVNDHTTGCFRHREIRALADR